MDLKDLPKQFQGKGIRLPQAQKRRRLVAAVKAPSKVGKTRLLYTMPRPQLQINFDLNSEGQEGEVVSREEDGVFVYDVLMPSVIDKEKDLAQFYKVRQFVVDAVDTKFFRSIGIDPGDDLWTLCQRGFFGATGFGSGGKQTNYQVPNGAMSRIFKTVRESHDVNLLVAHRLTQVRDESGKAVKGDFYMGGWKHTEFEVHAIIALADELGYECDRSKCQGKQGCLNPELHKLNSYSATIEKSQFGGKGEVLRGLDITFQNIAMLVHPTTQDTPEVWL